MCVSHEVGPQAQDAICAVRNSCWLHGTIRVLCDDINCLAPLT